MFHAWQWPIILPLGFFYVWLFSRPSFDILFFHLLHLILWFSSDASSNFKFVVTPRSSNAIHFLCVYLETKIGHESLNFVWAFTTYAFPQMLRSWWSNIFYKGLMIVLQLINSQGFHFKFVLKLMGFLGGAWKTTMMCMMCLVVSVWQKLFSHFQVYIRYYQSRLWPLKGVAQNTKIQMYTFEFVQNIPISCFQLCISPFLNLMHIVM
jgi:hypothetical protein